MNRPVLNIACMRGIFSLLVIALSLGLPLAGAAPELPSTPAGKVLAGYLEAVNSGNKDKLEAFIKAHRPDRPDALNIMLDLRWNTGGRSHKADAGGPPQTLNPSQFLTCTNLLFPTLFGLL